MSADRFSRIATVGLLLLLAACAGGTSSSRIPATLQSVAHRAQPPCTPSVWVSSLSANEVYGFDPTLCVTLNGTYGGLPFNGPYGLATDQAGDLYVADSNNGRLVVFDNTGTFVKVLSTTLAGTAYQPVGVCVSRSHGFVGVGNRSGSSPGNVEFFPKNAPNNSGPTGWATWASKPSEGYCAFTKGGNFIVDASDSGGGNRRVAYLARNHVNVAAQTLMNSGVTPASYWVGMYDLANNDVLRVATAVNGATTQRVYGWRVTGPPNGPLGFTPKPTYLLTSYPTATNPVQQLAPSQGGQIFVADYGAGETLVAPVTGGAVTTYSSVPGAVGVAIYPPAQW